MPKQMHSQKQLLQNVSELQARLDEAEETLNAIRTGSIDALVVNTPQGEQIFTLKGADQTYRALVESMTEGAVTVKGNIVSYCNFHFARMLRKPLEKVMGASIFDLIDSDRLPPLVSNLQKGRVKRGSLEAQLRSDGGKPVPVLLSASRFYSDDRTAVCLVVTDISERKEAEEALRASEERFQLVAGMSSDVIWDLDLQTGDTWRSTPLGTVFRLRPSQIKPTYKWWLDKVHPEDRNTAVLAMQEALKGKSDFLCTSYRFRRGDGTYAYVSDRGCVVRSATGKPIRMIGAMTDITEQREAELSRQQLSRSILNAQEQERQRVARDLHDSVNQLLSSAKYRLSSVALKEGVHVNGHLYPVHDLIEKAIQEVRLISRNLRPSELDDLGLISALKVLTQEFRKRTGIAARFRGQMNLPPASVPREVEMTLYRVAQEALTNVEKHSGARAARVALRCSRSQISLIVNDDGKGLPGQNGSNGKAGWGLKNMSERASLLGGSFQADSKPGRGTSVMIQIPIAISRSSDKRRDR